MPVYKCDCCNFITLLKSNYSGHLTTNKHNINNSKKLAEVSQKLVEVSQKLADDNENKTNQYKCKYCDKLYKHKSSLSKHIKYSCTKNKTEDLTELVRLLNLQIEKQNTDFQSQLQSQTKQIEKLMGKLEINNTYNTHNTINNVNINLLNYNDTDTSHLTDSDYEKCIKQVYNCVMKMIERVHFNPEKPENMNVYISNIKSKHIMMYKDNKWILVNKEELESIYQDKERLIENWMEENDNKDPQLIEKFNKYLKMDENKLKEVYDDVKLMMFNNKNLIKS
jgi:hypothetical protein